MKDLTDLKELQSLWTMECNRILKVYKETWEIRADCLHLIQMKLSIAHICKYKKTRCK
jgi:hypothetical protein